MEIVAKALGTYKRTYCLKESERLSTKIKLFFTEPSLGLSHFGVCGGHLSFEASAPAEQSSPRYWQL